MLASKFYKNPEIITLIEAVVYTTPKQQMLKMHDFLYIYMLVLCMRVNLQSVNCLTIT